jgi:transposase
MQPSPTPITYLGIDIAKLTLELSSHPALSKRRSYPNNPAGHRRLITALHLLQVPVQIICEATGGYERHLIAALHQADVSVTLLNPRQARDFARARGLLAKTDALDAAVLADYGRTLQPAPTTPRSQALQRLAALVARRQELLALITQEHNRTEHHDDAFVRRQALRLITALKRHLQDLEEQIKTLQRADELIDKHVARLCSVQGIGTRTAWLLLAALPELGSLRRGQAAALAGPGWLPSTTTAARGADNATSPTAVPWRAAPSTWPPWWPHASIRCCAPSTNVSGPTASRPSSL